MGMSLHLHQLDAQTQRWSVKTYIAREVFSYNSRLLFEIAVGDAVVKSPWYDTWLDTGVGARRVFACWARNRSKCIAWFDVNINTYTYTYIYIYIYICIVYVCIHMYICTYIHTYVYIHRDILHGSSYRFHISAQTARTPLTPTHCIHINIYIYMYIFMCIYIYREREMYV